MSSFFFSSPKAQGEREPLFARNGNDLEFITGKIADAGTKSRLSRMRKTKPPPINIPSPINISVERGNVIFTSTPQTSPVLHYANSTWSPTSPTTPVSAVCASPNCHGIALEQSTVHFNPHYSCPCALPWNSCTSTPQSPRRSSAGSFIAELPAPSSQPSFAELESPSKPSRFPFGNSDESPNSPSDLGSNGTRSRASTNNTRGNWLRGRTASKTEKQSKSDQEVFTKEDLQRITADFEVRMNSKETEISELLKLHHSRISTLRSFILPRLRPKESNDQKTREAMEILLAHEGKTGSAVDSDQLHVLRVQQIQEIQAQVTLLDGLVRAQDNKLKEYISEVESLKGALDIHKRKEQRMDSEIEEKDAQIAVLNHKISQLLGMRNRPGYTLTSSGFCVDKDLPCPG